MFKDLLGVEKAIVDYHEPNNLKDLVIPTRMKVCNERDLSASTHVEDQRGNEAGFAVKDRVQEIVMDDRASSGMIKRIDQTFQLVGRNIYYNNYNKRLVVKEN